MGPETRWTAGISDLLPAAAAVELPAPASLPNIARTNVAARPDPTGPVTGIAVLVAGIAAGYAALRWYRCSENRYTG